MPDDPHRFEFDLDQGIRTQLVERLEASPLLTLARGIAPARSGIYALYFEGNLVYVGKAASGVTRSRRTIRERLNEHVLKISKRQNIEVSDVSCRYLTFESDWWVFAAEFALMAHYRPTWNDSGFGAKTPGRGRPGVRISKWDMSFPPKP